MAIFYCTHCLTVETANALANNLTIFVRYFPDVWGFFKNGFLVMDGFADAGYLTLGLDYFRGVLPPLPSQTRLLSTYASFLGPSVETPQTSYRHDNRTEFRLRGLESEAHGILRRSRAQLGERGQTEVWQRGDKVRMRWASRAKKQNRWLRWWR